MDKNRVVLISITLLIFIISISCLNAANLNNGTDDIQSNDMPKTLQGTLGGGPQGGLGSEKPASALGSTLGGGSPSQGLGSFKPASPLGSTLGGGSPSQGLGVSLSDFNDTGRPIIIVDPVDPWNPLIPDPWNPGGSDPTFLF